MAVNTLHDIPGDHTDLLVLQAAGAGDATNYLLIWYAPFNCNVTSVKVVYTDAITGDNTNTFNLNLDDNDRTTELANVDFVTGTDAVAGTEITLYSPTAPGKSLDAAQNLYLERELVASGVAMPEGTVIVTYRGR